MESAVKKFNTIHFYLLSNTKKKKKEAGNYNSFE